jgi:hypothetical protein
VDEEGEREINEITDGNPLIDLTPSAFIHRHFLEAFFI